MSTTIINTSGQKAGTTDLASGVNSGSVLFVTPFDATPDWADAPLVVPPAGQPAVSATIRSFDRYGFSYTLSGKPPTTGYALRWRFVADLSEAFDFPDEPTGEWTWGEFIDQVRRRMTDAKPSETNFTLAQVEYVKSQLAMQRGDAPAYQIHRNLYTSMRRKLLGFQTGQTDAEQQTAVRTQIAASTPNDTLFEEAASMYVKAQLRRDGSFDDGLFKSLMASYDELRNTRLFGYTYTGTDAALLAAVQNRIFVTAPVDPNVSYLTAVTAAARRDLETAAAWFNAQVSAAADDLQDLYDRVVKEIRAGAITLQQVVEGYRVGHVSIFTEENTTVEGFAARGTMPLGAQIRDAWMIFPPPAVRVVNEGNISEGTEGGIAKGDLNWLMTDTTICRRKQCVMVPWEEKLDAMVDRNTNWPLLSVKAPQATEFLVAGQLVAGGRELELTWDGLRLDFMPTDLVPFDEGAAQAVAFFAQAQLAKEFGDGPNVWQGYERDFYRRQAELYVEFQDRRNSKWTAKRTGGWPNPRARMDYFAWQGDPAWPNCLNDGNWTRPPAAFPTDGSSFWLQLLDAVSADWKTISWTNALFVTGTWDWRIYPAPALTARISSGFLQLWDDDDEGWRSIWWNNGVLTAGDLDTSDADGEEATMARINVTDGVTTLQLADQAHSGYWRALYLSNGAATAGPLVAD